METKTEKRSREKLKERVLKADDVVRVVARTRDYGVAEFICCPVFRWGQLREVFLYPAQQPDATEFFRVPVLYNPQDFSVGSWTHKGMDPPRIWLHFWCKEHKCHSFRFYVPVQATSFRISMLSNFSIQFDCEPKAAP